MGAHGGLECAHRRPDLDLVLGVGHVHLGRRHLLERVVLDVLDDPDDRPHWPFRVGDAHLPADRIRTGQYFAAIASLMIVTGAESSAAVNALGRREGSID